MGKVKLVLTGYKCIKGVFLKNTIDICKQREELFSFEDLDSLLKYSPKTGRMVWRKSSCSRDLTGKEVGHINNQGYRRFKIGCEEYSVHRIAFFLMTKKLPKEEIDHINGIRSDNRWSNLREATRLQQSHNLRLKCSNTSGVNGVYWSKLHNKWRAKLTYEKKAKNLGFFINWFDAVCARKSAENYYDFHPNHGNKAK